MGFSHGQKRFLFRASRCGASPPADAARGSGFRANGGERGFGHPPARQGEGRSEEHTSELQSLMRTSYAVFCLKKNNGHVRDLTCLQMDKSVHSTQHIIS